MLDADAVCPRGDAADTLTVVDGIHEDDREGIAEVGGWKCSFKTLHPRCVKQRHLQNGERLS